MESIEKKWLFIDKENKQTSNETCDFELDGTTQEGIEETGIKRRLKKKERKLKIENGM